MIEISVIVPSYNHPKTIEKCIKSLLHQKFTREFEIIIVDSSGKEIQKKVESICQRDRRIKLIKRKDQTYPGSARNIGIKKALGDIIALIDADCIADDDWLENIYQNMDDDIILSGVIKNGTPENVMGSCSYMIEFSHFQEFSEHQRYSPAAATCNFACKRIIFEQIGYFSKARAYEDFLFCRKFVKEGGKIILRKDINVTHVNKIDLKSIRDNQFILGKYSAIARRENGLSPKLIFKYPILSPLLIGYRYVSILSRLFHRKRLFTFLWCTPVIVYLLGYWCSGFYHGSKE